MSKKSEQVAKLLDRIELPHGVPDPPQSGTLLERGMVLALLDHLPAAKAEAAVAALGKVYADWNEARVAQAQELARYMAPRGAKSAERSAKAIQAANAVRAYLQDVFQRTHGLDLEFLRADPAAAAKVVTAMPMLGNYLGSILLWMAEGEQPVTTSVVRVLDRLKLLSRTSSVKKAREAILPLIPSDQALRLAAAFGYVADRWCDPRRPICWECVLVAECPTGRKVQKDWKVQQERQAAQRAKEEARRIAAEEKERARREREEERERKREEARLAKAERERARKARAAAKKKEPKAPSPAKKVAKPAAAAKPRPPKSSAGDKPSGSGAKPPARKAPSPAKAARPSGGRSTTSRPAASSKTESRTARPNRRRR